MSIMGKEMRMRRVIDPITKTSVMFACSHGTSTPKILEGLEDIKPPVKAAIEGGANVLFLSLGMAEHCKDLFIDDNHPGLALKVSATAGLYEIPFQEVPIAQVQTALEIGADAVVAMLPLTKNNEKENIGWAAKLGEECYRHGMPFIAEAEFPNAYDQKVTDYTNQLDYKYLMRTARMCVELGADIVKTNWTGNSDDFRQVVDCIPGIPVVVAGGSHVSEIDLLTRMAEAVALGATGCSVGRNIFQHKDPVGMTKALCAVVKGQLSVEEAALLIKK